MIARFLEKRLPLWGWIPFVFLDFATKVVVMRAIGYRWGMAVVSAGLSSPLATITGLAGYHPFPKATAIRYGFIYFTLIVAIKLSLALSSGFTEVRGGVLLVDKGHWTIAGAQEKLFVAFSEAFISTVVLLALQNVLSSRRPADPFK